jgi:septum formation protein
MERILLASASSRRRELLETAGIAYEALAADVDEGIRDSLAPSDRVVALAGDKARAAAELLSARTRSGTVEAPRLVLGADTLVCLPGGAGPEQALGKPASAEEARRMLRSLSGRTHIVRTGIALLDRLSGELWSERSDTETTFARLKAEELDDYVATGEWIGAAGAYRVQGLGSLFIERLAGSWSGVVGLPMRELYVILRQAGYRFPALGRDQARAEA